MWTALERAYHKVTRIFRKHYFRFLPSKPEVIVPVWCNIKWINADFFKTNFSPRKFAYSVSAETCSQRNFVRNIGFRRSPTSVFEFGLKNRIQKLRGGTGSPCLRRLQMRKFLCRKITASFKLNLKADGSDCKMIFKFGSRVERLHSTRKQGRRIYNVCICKQCVCLYKHHLRCKMLVGNTQTLDLRPVDAGWCALANLTLVSPTVHSMRQ